MHSSTSSSDALMRDGEQSLDAAAEISETVPVVHDVRRDVPERNWLALGATSVLLCALALGVWERHVRSLGYEPGYDDTPSLWVKQRQRAVGARADQLVLVGASRTLYNLDLDLLEREGHGPRPIQLATVGSNPIVILDDLANDPSYAGTTLVGFVPPLWAAAGGPPIANPTAFVQKYHHWSPANDWELALTLPVQKQFAFLEQEDLSLRQLLLGLPLPRRTAAFTPDLPPRMSQLDRDRRTRMNARVELDPVLRQHIQQVWLPLFGGPPKPAVFSDAAWHKILSDGWESNLQRARADVAKIRARGGQVFFVRDPSSGGVRELEDRITPRAAFWDRLLQETGAPGIYDQDYPELRDFQCPDWSHLSASDSIEYTRRLSAIIKEKGWF